MGPWLLSSPFSVKWKAKSSAEKKKFSAEERVNGGAWRLRSTERV